MAGPRVWISNHSTGTVRGNYTHHGTGSNAEPLGLLNLPGKLSQAFAGATPSSAELALMLAKLGDAKVDLSKVVFLLHPSTAADLMQTEVSATSGELVLTYREGAYRIHGRQVFISTNVNAAL